MIGDTISLTIDSVAKVLVKIREDGYAAEYRLKETTQQFDLKIRHQDESPKAGFAQMERHNAELRQTVFGVSGAPNVVRYYSFTLRQAKSDDSIASRKLALGLVAWQTAGNLDKVLGWES